VRITSWLRRLFPRRAAKSEILSGMAASQDILVSAAGRFLVIPADAVTWQFARSAGPGGQHVNRTSTKALLRFDVRNSPHLPNDVRARLLVAVAPRLTTAGTLVITSQRHRVRSRNMADCRDKLADLVASCLVRPPPRRPTKKPRKAVAKRLDTKRHRSRTKELRREPDD
jgi:ribosome-associated protein